jgi:hypothetical protein
MTIRTDIEKLALMVAKEAMEPGKTFNDRLEALKILNPHYTALLKKKAPEEDDGEGTMNAFHDSIHGSEGINGKVRSRTRS